MRWGKRLNAKFPNRRQEGARYALIVLSCINLLNFADRYVPSSVKVLLKRDLHLSDTQTALPASGMVFVYMTTALFFGWVADMRLMDRRIILAVGVAFWSLVTALAGVSSNFTQLLVFRSLVGVGEAAYMTIVPPMIADFYPTGDRNTAYMVFNLCAPLGGALGYIAGALLGGAFSWRVAFFICGFPGILVALLVMTVNDPHPGINDPKEMTEASEIQPVRTGETTGRRKSWIVRRSALADVRDIIAVPHWNISLIGMIATSWTIGALADWYATFLVRDVKHASGANLKKALQFPALVLGVATMVGGIGGVLLGSKVADAYVNRWQNAFLRVPALFMVPTTILLILAMNVTVNEYLSYALILFAFIFFFTYMAPLYTVMYNCMPVHLRARSGAISILLSHVLGDVISPPIVGLISDSTGSLRTGLQLCWIMTAITGLVWGLGSFLLPPLAGAGAVNDDVKLPPTAGKDVGKGCEEPSPTMGSLLWGSVGDEVQEGDPEPEPQPSSSSYGTAPEILHVDA